MPGQVTIRRRRAAPTTQAAVDFTMLVIGCAANDPTPGQVSPLYGDPYTLAADFGLGDGPDAAQHALLKSDGNPGPPALCFYRLPPTTPGAIGTIDSTNIAGTAVPVAHSGAAPKGTYQIKVKVTDDGNGGAGGNVGTAGIVLQASVDNGRTWLPTRALGTATYFSVLLADDSDTGVKFDLNDPSATLTALYTKENLLRTKVLAHFLITSGSPAIHLAADTTDNTSLTAIPTATTPATSVALFNSMLTLLGTHGASTTYHTTADTALATALAAIPQAVDVADVELHLPALIAAYSAHIALVGVGPVHGSADGTNTITAYVSVPATLKTGDYWTCPTTPPAPAIGDIYTAGSPATGAFAAVLSSAFNFGIIVIEPPVAASDIATLSSALDYIESRKADRRPTLLVRFRDQLAGESDSTFIAAFATFRTACADDERICIVVGGGWLTDAIRDHVYLRSGLPSVLAMIQGMEKIPGARGERVAQHPGYAARGPLERFSIVDSANNPVGHDERERGGVDGPLAGKGGGLTFFHESADGIAGTYVSEAPVLYGSTPTGVVTLMDNRVSSGIERALYLVAFQALQGAAITSTVGGVTTIDDDARHAMAGAAAAAIRKDYANEIQNPNDQNLVSVDPVVAVNGSAITVTWHVADRLFLYVDGIDITIGNERP